MKKSVTMKQIADVVGVSTVTVSKVLTGKGGAGPDKREQILATAKKLGYRAKVRSNGMMHPQLSGNIGVIVSDLYMSTNDFYSRLYTEVVFAANLQQYSTALEMVTKETIKNKELPSFVKNQTVDGLLFLGQIDDAYIRLLEKANLPFVFLDFYNDSFDTPAVLSDSVMGMEQLMEYLLATNHKTFAYVGTLSSTPSIVDRYLGCQKALLLNGISPDCMTVIDDRVDQQLLEAAMLELPTELPDAFICNCDHIALSLIERLKSEGYQVPQDVSVVGFDGDYDYNFLTTHKVDLKQMAQTAFSLLSQKMEQKPISKAKIFIDGSLRIRTSTRDRHLS